MRSGGLRLVHVELSEANAFVTKHHRHHRKIQGHRFSLGAMVEIRTSAGIEDAGLAGVAIVGRPVGGTNQHEWVEITRLCTDGTRNACSFLYAAAANAAKRLGYVRIQTYILADEPGTSLKASGWEFDRMSHPVGWHHDGTNGRGRPARAVDERLSERKQLWYRDLR